MVLNPKGLFQTMKHILEVGDNAWDYSCQQNPEVGSYALLPLNAHEERHY